MEKQVVLFGAGASYGARNHPRPPLGKCLHKWVLRYFDKNYDELGDWEEEWGTENVRQALRNELKKTRSYETLANTLWKTGQRDLLAKLNFLLAASMTPPLNPKDPDEEPGVDDSFIEQPDLFDEWLNKTVEKRENLNHFTFITLNYDCLLERAICRTFFTRDQEEGQCRQCLCTHIHYPFVGGQTTGVEVLKLHGSINWIGNPLGNSENNRIPTPIFIDAGGISHYKNIKVVPTCLGEGDPQDPNELILATYAPGKPPQANPKIFQDIQNKAMERINEAQNIKIIGVHIPHIPPNEQDDPSLWELFLALQGKKVDFINPIKKECNLAKLLFNFNPIEESFKEFVDNHKSSSTEHSK